MCLLEQLRKMMYMSSMTLHELYNCRVKVCMYIVVRLCVECMHVLG